MFGSKLLTLTEYIHETPTVDIILSGWRQRATPVRSGTTWGCLLLLLLFSITEGVLARAIGQDKEMKGIHMEKGKVRPPLLADDMTLWNSCEELHVNTCKQKLSELGKKKKKTIRTEEHIYQGCRIQDQQKLNAISSH